MRSATPKHLHPLLGRRMVDWVVEAARAVGADPLVVVASPERRGRVRRGRGRRPGASRAAPATPSPRRATALDGVDGDVLVLSGDAPLLSPELLRDLARRRTAARTQPRPSSRSARPTRASTAASSATTTGAVREIVEAGDATPERARRSDEVNSSIYVFDADRSGPRSTGSTPQTRRASST